MPCRVAWVRHRSRHLVGWPLAARAQTKSQRRIAAFFASHADDPEVTRQVVRFQDELAKLGWVEGQTIHVDYRFGAGLEHYTALAKELVGLHPELIVTQTTPLTAAMQQETRTISIVFMRVSDPVNLCCNPTLGKSAWVLSFGMNDATAVQSRR